MSRTNYSSGAKWESIVGYSRAVKVGNTIEVTGTVAVDDNNQLVGAGDAYAQTREVLGHVDRLLAEARSDKRHILSATVYLSNMKYYADMNRAWDEWVEPGATPPRATVEAKLARPECFVEMQIVAAQV